MLAALKTPRLLTLPFWPPSAGRLPWTTLLSLLGIKRLHFGLSFVPARLRSLLPRPAVWQHSDLFQTLPQEFPPPPPTVNFSPPAAPLSQLAEGEPEGVLHGRMHTRVRACLSRRQPHDIRSKELRLIWLPSGCHAACTKLQPLCKRTPRTQTGRPTLTLTLSCLPLCWRHRDHPGSLEEPSGDLAPGIKISPLEVLVLDLRPFISWPFELQQH